MTTPNGDIPLSDLCAELEHSSSSTPPEAPKSDSDEALHGVRLVLTVISLGLSVFLVALDGTIVSTAIPRITDEFKAVNDVGWYGSAFFLTMAAFQAIWGKAYKFFWLKMTFLVAVVLFELGSLICAVAPDSVAFIIGRAIAGLGAAGVSSGAFTLIAFIAPPSKRPVAMGAMGAFYGVASALGPIIGGAITSNTTWRWCFYINLPIGSIAAAAVAVLFRTPPSARPPKVRLVEKMKHFDILGVILVLGSITCYLLAMQWAGQTKPWDSADVIGTLVGFGVLGLLFVGWDWFADDKAMLPRHLFSFRVVWAGAPYVFFLTGAYSTMIYYIPLFLQSVDGISPVQSGVRTLALVLALAVFLIISGGIVRRFGYFKANMIIGAVLASVGSGLIYTLNEDSSTGKWIGFQILVGAGVAMGWQQPLLSVQASVDAADIGPATALVLFFQTLGGAIFVSAGNCAFGNELVKEIRSSVPGLEPSSVISAGAGSLMDAYPANILPGVIHSYLAGLRAAYAVAIATAGVAFLFGLMTEWKKINIDAASKKPQEEQKS